MKRLLFVLLVLSCAAPGPAPAKKPLPAEGTVAEEEPKAKIKDLYIAIDAHDRNSQMLRSELERDWTKPNPKLNFNEKQLDEARKWGEQYNLMLAEIKNRLNFKFVEYLDDGYDVPRGTKLPAIKFGKYGQWESLDPRAFSTTTMPLLTINWHRWCYFEDDLKKKLQLEYAAKSLKSQIEQRISHRRILHALYERYPEVANITFEREALSAWAFNKCEGKWELLLDKPKATSQQDLGELIQEAAKQKYPEEFQKKWGSCDTTYILKDYLSAKGTFQAVDIDSYGSIGGESRDLDLKDIDCKAPETILPYRWALPPPPYREPGESFNSGYRPKNPDDDKPDYES